MLIIIGSYLLSCLISFIIITVIKRIEGSEEYGSEVWFMFFGPVFWLFVIFVIITHYEIFERISEFLSRLFLKKSK